MLPRFFYARWRFTQAWTIRIFSSPENFRRVRQRISGICCAADC
jgi:hypothetical protein